VAVSKPEHVPSDADRQPRPVFISYATADRKEALAVCKALERRGTKCWIATRDVQPGENYQEAIVRAIREARALVLVFSEAANNSDEIKKELSLVSRFHVPLMALRIEDVEPSDAFAYELSTRQWIDAFDSWDKSLDSLVRRLGEIDPGDGAAVAPLAGSVSRRIRQMPARTPALAALGAVLLLAAAAAWLFLRPAPAAAHSMMVRLTGFSSLSGDLPAGTPGAMRDEIIAAFNDDGVVGVSTAAAPPLGDAPAYALGGTIRRDGDKIKVNVLLTNERSGATLWSNIFSYDSDQLSRVPRHIAVDAGGMVRCGLFAASTYRKALPDQVLSDYLQYCANGGLVVFEPGKALNSAQKVVAAAPDFSWGWSAVASAAGILSVDPDSSQAAQYRKQSGEAADKAIALDPSNSEALDLKALLVAPLDLVGREALFKQALDARPLACGCEHHLYGLMLQGVGRNRDAVEEFRRSTEVLALDQDSQASLAEGLLIAGKPDEAKAHLDAALDLSSSPAAADEYAVFLASVTGDYAGALKALQNPKVRMPESLKAAIQAAFAAMVSRDPAAKARAVKLLLALPPDSQGRLVTTMLGALGAHGDVFRIIGGKTAAYNFMPRTWLFLPAMRPVLDDPAFPAFAQQVGLVRYWKTSHTRPDVCSTAGPPPFCRMI
jgi:tetratricopeptide (TPR) repeat protein